MILQVKASDLIYLLKREGVTFPGGDQCDISIHVPGGGDYSNMDLEITDDQPINIRWKE